MRLLSEELCNLEFTCVSASHRERLLGQPLLVRFDFLIVHRQEDDCEAAPALLFPLRKG